MDEETLLVYETVAVIADATFRENEFLCSYSIHIGSTTRGCRGLSVVKMVSELLREILYPHVTTELSIILESGL
jgi:hypothetical protein